MSHSKSIAPPAGGHGAAARCHNCGTEASGKFCPACGQATTLHAPSLAEFAHEFIGHYVALEGKLWGTISRLMLRPGLLTNEYVAGRRVRYVEPLRLYLSLSILFFALIKFSGFEPLRFDADRAATPSTASQPARGAAPATQLKVVGDVDDLQGLPPALAQKIKDFSRLAPEQKTEKATLATESFFHYAPYAMFFLMPVFALYLKILYLGSGRRYGEHILFALHSNAFAFVLFGLIDVVPWGFVKLVLMLWLLAYLPLAMRRVYGRGRFATVWRWLLLMTVHTLTLMATIAATLAVAVLR